MLVSDPGHGHRRWDAGLARVRAAVTGDRGRTSLGAALAFAIRIASAGLLYLSQIVLARWMGSFEYGIFVFVWVWVLILGGLSTLGLSIVLIRYIPEYLERHLLGVGDMHRVQPRLVSISQSTELGTVYTPEEIEALATWAHGHGLLLHVDGARLANAAASLGVPFRKFTTAAGVDLVSFGGTKNGAMGAEAILFLNGCDPADFPFIRKQGMQLGSKMRFLSAQFLALLEGDLWRRNAEHANRMARLLAERVERIPGVTITQRVEANGVFATVPAEHIPALQERAFFYVWDPTVAEVRWMTAWDTTEADVERFAAAVREIVR